jgi:serine/threonine-protein kinase
VRLLGQGGMGMVHLAEREADGTEVAFKTIIPALTGRDDQVRRFVREAEILKQLDHPHIVRFLDVGEAGEVLYFVMEYVRGTDAAKVLKERGQWPVLAAVRVACQVLEALAYAHGRGFVHRDIKPANVLLAIAGEKWRVKLADFGLARVYQASKLSGLTLVKDGGGTPAYIPPEQITHFRDVTPAADQYSLAAMLYHLLTGQYALDLPPGLGALVAIIEDEPVPLRSRRADIPDGLAAAVHRALAKRPAERYPDAAAFRAALAPFGR